MLESSGTTIPKLSRPTKASIALRKRYRAFCSSTLRAVLAIGRAALKVRPARSGRAILGRVDADVYLQPSRNEL